MSTAVLRDRRWRGPWLDEPDMVLILAAHSEISAVAVVHEREDAPAYRNTRFTSMTGLPPDLPAIDDLFIGTCRFFDWSSFSCCV